MAVEIILKLFINITKYFVRIKHYKLSKTVQKKLGCNFKTLEEVINIAIFFKNGNYFEIACNFFTNHQVR